MWGGPETSKRKKFEIKVPVPSSMSIFKSILVADDLLAESFKSKSRDCCWASSTDSPLFVEYVNTQSNLVLHD